MVKKRKDTPAVLKKIDQRFTRLDNGFGGWKKIDGGAVYQYTKPTPNMFYGTLGIAPDLNETKVPTIGEWAEEWYEKNR